MERREGAMSPGRFLLTEMVPGIFAVPEELHTLSPRDAIVRVNEFQAVTEKLKKLVLMSQEDFPKEEYSAVWRLRGLPGSESVLTMLEAFDKIKRDEKDPRNIRTPFDIMPDVKGTPQQTFSMMLVNGYAQYLDSFVNLYSGIETISKASIYEVIAKDFPDSSLAQDLKLQAPDSNTSQPDSLPRKADEEFRLVTFDAALTEGRSGAMSMLQYSTFYNLPEQLKELVNEFRIDLENPGRELGKKILDYDEDLGWDASVILSYIASNMSLQKTFAIIFLEQGKNAFNQLLADERHTGVGDIIFEVLNKDSLNKKFWWMFAPYLLDELWKNRKVHDVPYDPIDALKRILLWAATAETEGTTKDGVSIDLGLGQLNFSQHGADFHLSSNPQGASHKYVRQEARWLVNNSLLQRDELDPDGVFL